MILISTTRLGKKTIMIDESNMNNKSGPSWKYFDMEEMRNVRIVNDVCPFVAAQELSLIDGFAIESFAV